MPSPCRALTVLVAVLTLTTLELVRSSGPLLDMAFSQGVVSAAGAALATYALPGLLALALVLAARRTGPLAPLVVGTLLLAAARLVVQGLEAGLRLDGPGDLFEVDGSGRVHPVVQVPVDQGDLVLSLIHI